MSMYQTLYITQTSVDHVERKVPRYKYHKIRESIKIKGKPGKV